MVFKSIHIVSFFFLHILTQLAVSQNVGIGITSPSSNLHLAGPPSGDVIFKIDADSDNSGEDDHPMILFRQDDNLVGMDMGFCCGTVNSGNVFRFAPFFVSDTFPHALAINAQNGMVGVGNVLPSYQLEVGVTGDGSAARANSWLTSSDARWKTGIQPIENAAQKLEQLNGYYYYWDNKPDTSRQVGVLAQEVEAILPETVSTDENGYKSVDYGKLTALLIDCLLYTSDAADED